MNFGHFLKIILTTGFLLIMITFSYTWSGDADNDTTTQNAARNAMTQAINKGSVRVTEEVTINPRIAEEAFLRQYAETSNFDEGEKVLNIKSISSKPAMISVETYSVMDDLPGFKLLGNANEVKARQVDVVIYEAKKTTK